MMSRDFLAAISLSSLSIVNTRFWMVLLSCFRSVQRSFVFVRSIRKDGRSKYQQQQKQQQQQQQQQERELQKFALPLRVARETAGGGIDTDRSNALPTT